MLYSSPKYHKSVVCFKFFFPPFVPLNSQYLMYMLKENSLDYFIRKVLLERDRFRRDRTISALC